MTDRARVPWSPDEDDMLREMNHRTARDIAFVLGRSMDAVKRRRSALKLRSEFKMPCSREWTAEEDDHAVFLSLGGWYAHEIAEVVGVSTSALDKRMRHLGAAHGARPLDEWGWTINDDFDLRAQMQRHGDVFKASKAMGKDEFIVRIRAIVLGL